MRTEARAVLGALLLGAVAAAAPRAAAQADIVIVNGNNPGEGFNDPTPVDPVGGNSGTTLGEQRLIAFRYAASLWSKRITSPLSIRVKATFEPLPCDATSAVLGSAGASYAVYDDPAEPPLLGLPLQRVWYTAAESVAVTGQRADPMEEIVARFNSTIGTTCSFPTKWYYGLDAQPPGRRNDLVTIVQHEITHGLGFLSLVDGKTGKRFLDKDDVFSNNLLDMTTKKGWPQMTDQERSVSALNNGNLVWSGAAVSAASGQFTSGVNQGKAQMYAPATFKEGSSVSHWDIALNPPELMQHLYRVPLHDVLISHKALADMGWPLASGITSFFLPSSARVLGGGGSAFYTTDLTIGNRSSTDANVTLKFLGNGKDGRDGAEKAVTVGAGKSVTFTNVLESAFGVTGNDFGAIRIASSTPALNILGQTSTPGAGGTFGQSVPAASPQDLITNSNPRSIVALREDAVARTNLILANATEAPLDVDLILFGENGLSIGSQRLPTFQPLEMRQVTRVVSTLSGRSDVASATIALSTPTTGGAFAAYASVIDNGTNDPRTLLPASTAGTTNVWLLPSSARVVGGGGAAFYTTDLTVGNRGNTDASLTLKFLGNTRDGSTGPQVVRLVGAGKSTTLTNILESIFGITGNDFGAIQITSSSSSLNILGQTSTPGAGGTFGQSVPAAGTGDLITNGNPHSIVALREDAQARTNLIIVNATQAPLDVDLALSDQNGAALGTQRLPTFQPLEMRQVTRVVSSLSGQSNVTGATIVLSTPTSGGAFAAYASVIDNGTQDPRTLLPR